MTIADAGVELKQTTRVKFTVKFGTPVASLGIEDVTVKGNVDVAGGSDKVDYLVKAVTLADDKKSAEVEVFYAFNDGITYDVTVKGYDTESFVASNGAPTSAVLHSDQYDINKRTVTVGTTANIYATLYDANNVDVTTPQLCEKLLFNIKYVDSSYETSDTTLYFTEVGDRAVVTAEYHTYEFEDNGDEKDFFTSAPFTFVSVAEGQTKVEKILAYTTNGNLNKTSNAVKLGGNPLPSDNTVGESGLNEVKNLKVRIKLTDDPDYKNIIDLTAYDQEIVDRSDVLLGTAKFTSMTPDIAEVYETTDVEGNKVVGIKPRKEGNARIMVSYVTSVNGYDVETAIGIVNVTVQGKITLTSVSFNAGNTAIISADPDASMSNITFRQMTINDQYYNAYGYNKGYNRCYTINVEGKNDLSKRTLEGNYGSALEVVTDVEGWKTGINLDSAIFLKYLNDMDGDGDEDEKLTKATRYSYTVTVTDKNAPYGSQSVDFFVDVRRPLDTNNDGDIDVKDMGIELVAADDGTVSGSGNNVARWDTFEDNQQQYYNRNTENEKYIRYEAYYTNNGARWGKITLDKADVLPVTKADIQDATPGYYYVLNKGGKNISETAHLTDGFKLTFGRDRQTYVKANATTGQGGALAYQVTDYADWQKGVNVLGAGTYEFILYEIVETENSKGEIINKVVQKGRKSNAVTCDIGSYKFVSRDAVSFEFDGAYNLEDAELQQALLKCFTFADKTGSEYIANNVRDNNTVMFDNGQVRDFHVNLNAEKSKDDTNSVYVESVTFWEAVAYGTWSDLDSDSVNETPSNPTLWAEYTVPVGYFVTIK